MLLSKALKFNDAAMRSLVTRIIKIPEAVRRRVLTLYVRRCRDFYQIAFFQWRKKYPSKWRFNLAEIEELIDFRIKF